MDYAADGIALEDEARTLLKYVCIILLYFCLIHISF